MRSPLPVLLLAIAAACGPAAPPPEAPAPEPVPDVEPPPSEPGESAPEPAFDSQAEFTAEELGARLDAEGRVALHSVVFQSGTSALLPEAHPALAQIVVLMRDRPDLRIGIEVHSDSSGTGSFNRRITEQRAGAIRAWLEEQGVEAERLEAAGFGEDRPIAPNSTEEGRSANRRVEIVVR